MNKIKILMLEDDPTDVELIKTLLHRSGLSFSSVVVSNEKNFLEALQNQHFHIVLSDNALPQYNSLYALHTVKKHDPFIGFILVTGTVSEEFAADIIKQGADDYILKTNLTRLPAAIEKVLETKRLQKEKFYAEEERLELNEQLRNLTTHLQNIREEEQIRISREIHDEIGQLLAATKFTIISADKRINRSVLEAKSSLAEALQLLETTVQSVRRISSGLRPLMLDDLGLIPAIEAHTKEFAKQTSITVSFSSELPSDFLIEKNIATPVFRIYQELLTNVLKHSGADNVIANFIVENDHFVLTVKDNGKGFEPGDIRSKKTFGLLGIKERLILLKGNFTIDSSPGSGALIIIKIPLSPDF